MNNRRVPNWTDKMCNLLLFMKQELDANDYFCYEVLRREYPLRYFTASSVKSKYKHLRNAGARYQWVEGE